MKLYGGRFLRNKTEKAISRKVESRDGQLYSIDPLTKTCQVKIQGTSTLITAYYPENWEATPAWLKPGNAVRFSHTGGNSGRVELVGHGALIPTPVAGDVGDPPITLIDGVLAGLQLFTTASGYNWRTVLVQIGTYQISNLEYTRGPIKMKAAPKYVMGHGGYMGEVAGAVDVSNGTASFQFDAVNIAADGVLDVQAGTAATPPLVPAVPSAHVRCGTVLLYNGITEIVSRDLNASYKPRIASSMSMVASDVNMTWAESTSTLTINVKDTYGAPIYEGRLGWLVRVEFLAGNGTLQFGSNPASATSAEGYTTTDEIQFTYTRGQTSGDSSPIIAATLINYGALQAFTNIMLQDESGNYM